MFEWETFCARSFRLPVMSLLAMAGRTLTDDGPGVKVGVAPRTCSSSRAGPNHST